MALTKIPSELSATALTITTAAQPNITSVGTLTALTTSGTVTSTGGHLNLSSDGAHIYIGADIDMRLTHSGSAGTFRCDTGDMTFDVGGDIFLDADGGQVYFQDGGTLHASIDMTGGVIFRNHVSDADIFIQGNDGGSNINMLTFDTSEGGRANFNNDIGLSDNRGLRLGSDDDAVIYNDGSNTYIKNATSNQDIIFQGNDDGSTGTTALTLDMSAGGLATFGGEVSIPYNATYGLRFYNQPGNNWSSIGNDRTDSAADLVFKDSSGQALRLAGGNATFAGDVAVTGGSSGSTVLTLTSNALADTPLMVFQRTGGAVAGKLAYEDGNTAISFGTTTAHELKLLTNNTNRLEIDSSGNSTFAGNVTATNLYVTEDIGHSGDANTYISFDNDNHTYYAGGTRLLDLKVGDVIFNEGGGGVDFRIESASHPYMFFVDASENGVGIGDGGVQAGGLKIQSATGTTNAIDVKLYLNARSSGTTTTGFGPGIVFAGDRNGDGATQQMARIDAIAEVNSGTTLSSGLSFQTATAGVNSERLRITNTGNVAINMGTATTAMGQHKLIVNTDITNGAVGNTAFVHFGAKNTVSNSNSDGYIQGISLGYHENNNSYKHAAIAVRMHADGAARRDMVFLLNTVSEAASAELADAKLTIASGSGEVSGDLNDTSDLAFKENVADLGNTLDIVKQFKPRTFTWKDERAARGDSVGFIAQEMKTVISDSTVVTGTAYEKRGDTGHSINTVGLVAYLTKAIQELSDKLDSAEARIKTLEDS